LKTEQSLVKLINNWLERMPFFEKDYWFSFLPDDENDQHHPFWISYREIYRAGLTEREAGKVDDFDYVFLEQTPAENAEPERLVMLRSNLSAKAMRAALFHYVVPGFSGIPELVSDP
jgi:tryptophan 2,3-dioxygenase